jgi:hypothetical protein
MNDIIKTDLTDRATRLLDYLETSVEKGGDFLSEQAPEVVRELILYHRVLHTSYVVAAIVVIFVSMFAFWKMVIPESRKSFMDQNDAIIMVGGSICFLVLVATFIVLLIHTSLCLKVWLAPRVFILEEIARLLK